MKTPDIQDIAKAFKPCPFCGESDTLSFIDISFIGAMACSVTCDECEFTMSRANSLDLLAAWNRREYTDNRIADIT